MASIAEKGVIEPVVVTPRGEQCLLLAGERRLLACRKLGLTTIPARIITDVASREEILAIQLIENLQREEIDAIDKANGIVAFFQSRHGEQLPDLDSVYSVLMTYEIDPGRVESNVAETVSAIVKIIGVTPRSIRNILSLLRLAEDIQETIRTGVVPVSQGYILAENLDNPGLRDVLEAVVANPVTNRELTRMLKKAGTTGPANSGRLPVPFKAVYASLRAATKDLESGKVRYGMEELENLLAELKELIDVIETAKAGGGTAATPTALRRGRAKSAVVPKKTQVSGIKKLLTKSPSGRTLGVHRP